MPATSVRRHKFSKRPGTITRCDKCSIHQKKCAPCKCAKISSRHCAYCHITGLIVSCNIPSRNNKTAMTPAEMHALCMERKPNREADSEDASETESVDLSENASEVFPDAISESHDEAPESPRAEKRERDLDETPVFEGSEASIQARAVCPNRACRVAFFFPIAAPIVRCRGCAVEYDSGVLNVVA